MKAVLTQSDKTVKVEEVPLPVVGAEEILIKVICAGLNPTDWKHLEFIGQLFEGGNLSGCDFVGEVVELGANVPKDQVKEGEIRWGFVHGATTPTKGAFAEYMTIEWVLTGLVPSKISPQQAATTPIPFMTCVQVFYLRLGLPQYPEKANGEWILIWGGGTACGQYGIQLAKLSGLKVATTASPGRWEQLREYGADLTLDYNDPDIVQKLKDGTGDSIQYGLDCVGMGGSLKKAQLTFRPQGGHLVTILDDLSGLPRTDVKTEPTILYSAIGVTFPYGGVLHKPTEEDRNLFIKYAKLSTELFENDKIKPIDLEVVGGLDDVQDALTLLKSGKHKKKMVINI